MFSNYKFQQIFHVGASEDRISVLYNTRCKATNWSLLIHGFLCWDQFQNPGEKPQALGGSVPFNELEPKNLIKGLLLSGQGRMLAWD